MSQAVQQVPLTFECGSARLLGVLARPGGGDASSLGLLIIVGGPQYRVGAHRQFLLLAQRAAASGFATLRFDYRGMGDSDGETRAFDAIDADIEAAIDAFQAACPQVKSVALWGLCDGASAALLYCRRRRDPRVAALCLVNPWVRSEASLARARVRHYYPGRLIEKDFWMQVFRGRANPVRSLAGFLRNWRAARSAASGDHQPGFRSEMAAGMREFGGAVLLILSGRDATAQEFLECARSDPEWAGVLDSPRVSRFDVAGADHTFSDSLSRGMVDGATVDWLRVQVGAGGA